MSESDHSTHSRRLHAKSTETHREWVKGLSAEQKANLARLGVLQPAEDSHEVGGHSPHQIGDISESQLARVEPDMAGHLDGQAGPLADEFNIPLSIARRVLDWHVAAVDAALRTHEAELLSVVVGGLLASKNVRIASASLAFASEMDAANNLGCQADFARSIGVSRTILSKAVKAWKRQLNLRPNIHQKSEAACATYSAVAKERHWRKQKVNAKQLSERINSIRKKSA